MDIVSLRRINLRAAIDAAIASGRFSSDADFANHYDINPSQISQLVKGHGSFGEKAARNLEKKIGWEAGLLDAAPGVDDQIQNFLTNTASAITTDELTQEERDSKIWIDMYNVRFCSGMGESIEFHFDEIKKQLSFESSFFEKRNIKPKNFKLIINKGDSNEEYLFDGDAVGIDTSDTDIQDGETYALYFEGEALIRQIFKQQGGVLKLHPRNPKYDDKLFDTNAENSDIGLKIIGRVRYRSG